MSDHLHSLPVPLCEFREHLRALRVARVAHWLRYFAVNPWNILEYGCGAGDASEVLANTFAFCERLGVDKHGAAIGFGHDHHREAFRFLELRDYWPARDRHLVYCEHVFQQLAPVERERALGVITDALRPGGLLVIWEHNPRRCAEADLKPKELKALLQRFHLVPLRCEYHFMAKRTPKWLKPVDTLLGDLPWGHEFMLLAHRDGFLDDDPTELRYAWRARDPSGELFL